VPAVLAVRGVLDRFDPLLSRLPKLARTIELSNGTEPAKLQTKVDKS